MDDFYNYNCQKRTDGIGQMTDSRDLTAGRTFRLTGGCSLYAFNSFMKVVSSIKSAKKRHPACQVVRRKGKIYVINKVEPRYKARQG